MGTSPAATSGPSASPPSGSTAASAAATTSPGTTAAAATLKRLGSAGTAPAPHHFVTIPASHYVERARWALDLAGVPYAESKYPPMVHYAGTVPLGGKSVPVLRTPSGNVLRDSQHILDYAHALRPSLGLYPSDPALAAEVRRWEAFFSRKLGVLTRVVCYHYLFQDRDLTMALLTTAQGVPWGRAAAFRACAPVIVPIMKQGMNVNEKSSEKCLERVREIFKTVSDHLEGAAGDGGAGGAAAGGGVLTAAPTAAGGTQQEQQQQRKRRYLVGESFTAADLTFAAMTAILLGPQEGYGAVLWRDDQLPPGHPCAELRATPAGQHALRMYREHRRPAPPAPAAGAAGAGAVAESKL